MSTSTLFSFIFSTTLAFSMSVSGHTENCWLCGNKARTIKKRLNAKIQSSTVKRKHLSIIISSKEGLKRQIFFQLNPEKKKNPASLSKIITAIAALNYWPVDKKPFETLLLSDGEIKETTLNGNLYLKGGGDPSFTPESLWSLVNKLTSHKIKKITGNIVIDDFLFDRQYFDKSRIRGNTSRAYAAPTSATSLAWNTFAVFVRPNKKEKNPCHIFFELETSLLKKVNLTKTVRASDKNKNRLSVVVRNHPSGQSVIVDGTCTLGSKTKVFYRSVKDPVSWIGQNLKEFLAQRGISVKGKIKHKKAPESAKVLARLESKSLPLIIRDLMKYSNNNIAESLAKSMSSDSSQPGSIVQGVKKIKKTLKDVLKPSSYTFKNPSGYTYSNSISARSLHSLFIYALDTFNLSTNYLFSLPVSGVDGTIKDRLGDSLKGRVRAKTGLLRGITALAGVLATGPKNKNQIVFVFIYNGLESKVHSANTLFTTILEELTHTKI